MLLTMKSFTEGMRSIVYYTGFCEDMIRISESAADKARWQGLIDVLIPITKGYVSDRAFDVCDIGVQMFGGYGYTKEYPQEQLLRDCKITHIYEGTNGIQAMDLLGRKLGLNKGQSFRDLLDEMRKTVTDAKAVPGIEALAVALEGLIVRLEGVALHMARTARSEKMLNAYAAAYPFMEATGDTVMAWMLLWRAAIAGRKLADGAKKKDVAFYEGQVMSARFFINNLIPVTLGKMNAILADDDTVMEISEEAFGGK
jgi:hypothetical protein